MWWALGSINTNKDSGGGGIPVELFQILKDDAVKVLHSICQQIWKTQQWPQDWTRSVFIPIPKKGNAKECSNYCTVALISHTSKVMLKILQARLQQYVNRELPDVQAGFRKGRGTRDQIANIRWIIEKAREFQENISSFVDYTEVFDCVDRNKLWKILKETGIPDHLSCLLRNLYAGQKQQLEPNMEQRTGSILEKEYLKAVYCHLLIICSEYIMWNVGLDEAKVRIQIARRNISNLRYVDDYHPYSRKWRGTEEPLDKGERREWNNWLKTQHSKNEDLASGPITSWQIDWETMETVADFIFLGSKITGDGDCSHEIERCLLVGRKAMTNLYSIFKSRHITLLTKVLYNQSCGFSSSHVRMWELDHKESWVTKNWYFWTVVLGKTLESPLDCEDIKAISPKGNQS